MTKDSDAAAVDLLFDARHIKQSGIGTYIRTGLPHLEQALNARGMTLAVLADADSVPAVRDGTRIVLAQPANASMYSWGEQKAWNHALAACTPRALWVPHYPFPMPLFKHANRTVTTYATVHDTIHLRERAVSDQSPSRRAYAHAMLRIDAARCRRIFTPSEATAETLLQLAPAARTLVTPIPVDDVWLTPAEPALAPVEPPYLLYVGNVKKHKNLATLVRAYADVADDIPQRLVIAGGGESLRTLDEDVHRLADAQGDRVVVTGRLEFGALRALVAGADLLVMPSLHEGAGLPPLEAMASRTAVLSSDIPSLRETCGNGADYFPALDHRALADLIRTHCTDAARRGELADRGWSHVSHRQSTIVPTLAADAICADLEGR